MILKFDIGKPTGVDSEVSNLFICCAAADFKDSVVNRMRKIATNQNALI